MTRITNLTEWAAAVKSRDGKCLDCGAEQDLHAHHIQPKATHPELKLALDNGKTLCYRCHKATHERDRPARLNRARRPRRSTLEKRIAQLERELAALQIRFEEVETALLAQTLMWKKSGAARPNSGENPAFCPKNGLIPANC